MHFIGRFDENRLAPPGLKYANHSEGCSLDSRVPTEGKPSDLQNLKGSLPGHFDMSQIPPIAERQDVMPGPEGVFLDWLIDSKFGASHHRMAFIEDQPAIGIGPHDHTLEERYFVLSGAIEGTLNGNPYLAKADDFLWTGSGSVYSFKNKSTKPVRRIETFSSASGRNAFRFMAEWEKRAMEMEG